MGNLFTSTEGVHTVLVRDLFAGTESEKVSEFEVSVDFNKGVDELYAAVAEHLGKQECSWVKQRSSFRLRLTTDDLKDEAGGPSLFDLGFQYRDTIVKLFFVIRMDCESVAIT